MNDATNSTWALLFDWDGVVIDSSGPHEESWERLAAEESLPLPDGHFKKGFGMRNEQIIPGFLNWAQDPAEVRRLADRKEQIYREIIREEGLSPLPGVQPFLDDVHRRGIACAVASSTPIDNLHCAIEVLGLEGYFSVLVASGDVERGKPDPDVFLKAAQKLDVGPEQCLVLEDAPVGIQAAQAAGMRVIGVAGTHPGDTLAGVDRLVHRLDELDLDELQAWMAG